MQRVLVSWCLLSNPVRYNGSDATPDSTILDKWVREGNVISFCPELAAGFPVPREAAEISRGNGLDVLDGVATVTTQRGDDLARQYVFGAQQAPHSLRRRTFGSLYSKTEVRHADAPTPTTEHSTESDVRMGLG